MSQQTAVEWLKKKLEDYGSPSHLNLDWTTFDELCKQAEQMEKDQLIKFSKYILEGVTVLDYYEYEDFEEYYNEIFKK